ncbi:MAG: cold-shock protein, partial [Brachybacterium sp.]
MPDGLRQPCGAPRPARKLRPRPGNQYSQTDEQQTRNGIQVPRGKVKFYDAEKGFGFILDDEDG